MESARGGCGFWIIARRAHSQCGEGEKSSDAAGDDPTLKRVNQARRRATLQAPALKAVAIVPASFLAARRPLFLIGVSPYEKGEIHAAPKAYMAEARKRR